MEFAKPIEIDLQPAFSWWVPFTLRKRDRIIAAVKRTTHKYGIDVPMTIAHAKKLDVINGDRLWQDAIKLEMSNVAVAFEIVHFNTPIPIRWTQSSGHIIFDVKMDFTRKARWGKDGHKTPQPDQSTFAGVVSRESVRISFLNPNPV